MQLVETESPQLQTSVTAHAPITQNPPQDRTKRSMASATPSSSLLATVTATASSTCVVESVIYLHDTWETLCGMRFHTQEHSMSVAWQLWRLRAGMRGKPPRSLPDASHACRKP